MNTIVSSRGTSLDEAIKLSATYFDEKSKTSKLLILFDGEDHPEGAQAAADSHKLGMRIVTVGIEQKRRNNTVEGKRNCTKPTKDQTMKL
jgi:Ca-activated chloride channel family protein